MTSGLARQSSRCRAPCPAAATTAGTAWSTRTRWWASCRSSWSSRPPRRRTHPCPRRRLPVLWCPCRSARRSRARRRASRAWCRCRRFTPACRRLHCPTSRRRSQPLQRRQRFLACKRCPRRRSRRLRLRRRRPLRLRRRRRRTVYRRLRLMLHLLRRLMAAPRWRATARRRPADGAPAARTARRWLLRLRRAPRCPARSGTALGRRRRTAGPCRAIRRRRTCPMPRAMPCRCRCRTTAASRRPSWQFRLARPLCPCCSWCVQPPGGRHCGLFSALCVCSV